MNATSDDEDGLSPAAPATAWRQSLRQPAVAYAWLAAALVVALVLAQQIAGRPIGRRYALPPAGNEVLTWRFPREYQPTPWNNAVVRVTQGAQPVPRYTTPALLAAAPRDGFLVRGREIQYKAPGGTLSARLPWSVSWKTVFIFVGLLLASGAALRYAGNAAITNWARRGGLALGAIARWGVPLLGLGAVAVAIAYRAGFWLPDWENDTGSYLESILSVMHGGGPIATPDRPFAYPLFVGLLLRIVPDFRAIVVAHWFATFVAAGAVAAVLWLAGNRLFPARPGARLACRVLALAAFCALTLNERLVQREWGLVAEAWTAFYLGLQIWLAWLLASRSRPLSGALPLFAMFCAAGLLVFFSKSNWGFALAALPIPWLAATWAQPRPWRSRLGWLLSGAIALLALAWAGFAYQAHYSRYHGLVALYDRARALVCWHVPLVLPDLQQRLRANPEDARAPVWRELEDAFVKALARPDHGDDGAYPSLGFDPDMLFYRTVPEGPRFRGLTTEQRTTLCSDLFLHALKRNPAAYARKVLTQLTKVFTTPYQRPTIAMNRVLLVLEHSETAAREETRLPRELGQKLGAAAARAKVDFARPWPSAMRLAFVERTVVLFDFVIGAFVWMLAAPVAVLLTALLWRPWRAAVRWRALAPALAVASWALASAILNGLSSAATQGLDVQRYIELSMPVSILAQALWPVIALALILRPGSREETLGEDDE
jgi:hypothetical protein